MNFGQGVGFFLRGVRLWRERPGLMVLGIVPALVAAAIIVSLMIALLFVLNDLIAWATPFADDWGESARGLLRVALFIGVMVGTAMLAVITFTGLTLAVGDPFYEKIWQEVEQSIGGEVPDRGVGWLRGAVDGLALILLGIVTAALVFLIGLLPLIGALVGGVLGVVLSGRLLAGELVSRPLEARGMDRAARKALMRGHRGAMLGFGISVQLCFFIPFGAIAVMPAAVAGATHLAREALALQGP